MHLPVVVFYSREGIDGSLGAKIKASAFKTMIREEEPRETEEVQLPIAADWSRC